MYVQRDKGNKLVFFCKHELKSLLGMDLDALCISNKTHKAAAKLICAHIRMWNVQRVKNQNRRRGGGYLQDLKKRGGIPMVDIYIEKVSDKMDFFLFFLIFLPCLRHF